MNPPGSLGVNGRGAMLAPMSARQGTAGTPKAADHMLFYSVCQATFYVLCFRGEELAAMADFEKQVRRCAFGRGWCEGMKTRVPGTVFYRAVSRHRVKLEKKIIRTNPFLLICPQNRDCISERV